MMMVCGGQRRLKVEFQELIIDMVVVGSYGSTTMAVSQNNVIGDHVRVVGRSLVIG